MSGGDVSGVDVARQTLLAAREAARRNGATRHKPKRRTITVVQRDGREPLGLGSAIGMMMTERGMAAPAAGGSLLADFDTILTAVVPELAGRVKAVAFDAETGRLDVAPDLPAAGTQLRWSAPKLVAAANERVRGANVRALHVLTPGLVKADPATAAAEPAPQPTAPAVPEQRAAPPKGYREALAAHRATWNSARQHTNPRIQAAAERQLRERLRESEEHFADGRQALDELRAKAAAQQQVRPSDVSRARALQRLAAERAELATITPAAVPQRLDRQRERSIKRRESFWCRAEFPRRASVVVLNEGGPVGAKSTHPTSLACTFGSPSILRPLLSAPGPTRNASSHDPRPRRLHGAVRQ